MARHRRHPVLFIPTALFWATYEQGGNTIVLWATPTPTAPSSARLARRGSRRRGFSAFNPFMIFAFTPFVVALWTRQAARGTEPSTDQQNGARLFRRRALLSDHGGCGMARRRGPGELAWLFGLFRHHHGRRALSFAGRVVAGDQDRAGPDPLDDDGRMAGDKFVGNFLAGGSAVSGAAWKSRNSF